jgi:hypothetical protein
MAEDAVPCELFSGPNSLLTGKNTGKFDGQGRAPGRKVLPDSTLAGEQCCPRRIKTGNYQGRNRECDSLIRGPFVPISGETNPYRTKAAPESRQHPRFDLSVLLRGSTASVLIF